MNENPPSDGGTKQPINVDAIKAQLDQPTTLPELRDSGDTEALEDTLHADPSTQEMGITQIWDTRYNRVLKRHDGFPVTSEDTSALGMLAEQIQAQLAKNQINPDDVPAMYQALVEQRGFHWDPPSEK